MPSGGSSTVGDIASYYPARHAPQAQVDQHPDYFGRRPVGTISRPAMDSDVQGTGSLLSGPKRNRSKGARGMASMSGAESPLSLDNRSEILDASGLGRRAPAEKHPAEEMSDASKPTQGVQALPNGSFVHHRMNPATGNVNTMPIGSVDRRVLDNYPHLNYDPMPANVGELQQRLGVPNIFESNGEG